MTNQASFEFQQLITPTEAAKLLGISPGTLAVWRCTKRYNIPYVRIGTRVKYRPEDLAAFIEQRTRSNGITG